MHRSPPTLVLFGPLRLAGNAIANLIQPEMAGSLAAGEMGRVRTLIALGTASLMAVCVAYGLVTAAILPMIEAHVFAGRFLGEPMRLIGFGAWAISSVSLLYVAPKTMLETMGAFKKLTFATLCSACIGLPIVTLLLWKATPAWSLLGLLVSELVILGYCWRTARRSIAALRSAHAHAQPATEVWSLTRPSAVVSPASRAHG